ncbi:hypothetical protein M9435_002529 [Picochlorum sp. BPE23]|nr:hypothetical protein M9435_002529 [Picochlorum sp. BPE23]
MKHSSLKPIERSYWTSPVRKQHRIVASPSKQNESSEHQVGGTTVAYSLQLEAQYATPTQRTRPVVLPGDPEPLLAYEMIKGNLVRFSSPESTASRPPPTAVLVHGVLGSKRNMHSFANKLVRGYPHWQVLLVDLRCHGDSAEITPALRNQSHSVESAADDVLKLLQALKLFPEVLIGHSFGGKVVMSMAHQFGSGIKRLPRPVQVWVLDALPGDVRSVATGSMDGPEHLIKALKSAPLPIKNRCELVNFLEERGFSHGIAAWAATNLTPLDNGMGLTWKVDLEGIDRMFRSYATTNLWPLLEHPADGIEVSFVRAERSSFRWSGEDQDLIQAYGHRVHLLRNSGHWVHADNPDGLFDIISSNSFGTPDIHMQRSPGSPSSLN